MDVRIKSDLANALRYFVARELFEGNMSETDHWDWYDEKENQGLDGEDNLCHIGVNEAKERSRRCN